jgi:hypothetical protein
MSKSRYADPILVSINHILLNYLRINLINPNLREKLMHFSNGQRKNWVGSSREPRESGKMTKCSFYDDFGNRCYLPRRAHQIVEKETDTELSTSILHRVERNGHSVEILERKVEERVARLPVGK